MIIPIYPIYYGTYNSCLKPPTFRNQFFAMFPQCLVFLPKGPGGVHRETRGETETTGTVPRKVRSHDLPQPAQRGAPRDAIKDALGRLSTK